MLHELIEALPWEQIGVVAGWVLAALVGVRFVWNACARWWQGDLSEYVRAVLAKFANAHLKSEKAPGEAFMSEALVNEHAKARYDQCGELAEVCVGGQQLLSTFTRRELRALKRGLKRLRAQIGERERAKVRQALLAQRQAVVSGKGDKT